VGFVLILILQLAHIMASVEFPEPSGDPLAIENEWAIHQVRTTVDFAPRNALLNWYVGGLNYQIEHHLFPQVCHLNYPKIAPVVQQVCAEYGVPYRVHVTLRAALADHCRLLKSLGQKPEPVAGTEPRRALRAAGLAGE
jgi:linoleoyl-CoA desaturase